MKYETVIKNAKKHSARNLARLAKISPTTASRIHRGHVPDIKTLKAICVSLGVKTVEINVST